MNYFIKQLSGPLQIQSINDDTETIHISRVDGMGDLLFMQPALKQLKKQFPQLKIVLHTHPDRSFMKNFLDIDQVIHDCKKDGRNTINLNWSLEHHPATRCLDRVTIWQYVFNTTITDDIVEIRRPLSYKQGCNLLAQHPGYHSHKPNLYYAPYAAHDGRALENDNLADTVKALSHKYNIIYLTSGEARIGFGWENVLQYPWTTLEEFYHLLCGCDVGWCTDTGGLYFAAAMGIPCIGVYDHVEPWLRTKRIPNIRALSGRLPQCMCQHHSKCTRNFEVCRSFINTDLMEHELDVVQQGTPEAFINIDAWTLRPMQEPRIALLGEQCPESLVRCLKGVKYDFVDTPDERHAYVMNTETFTCCENIYAYWAALDDLLYQRAEEPQDFLAIPGRPQIVPKSYYNDYLPGRYIVISGNIDTGWTNQELDGGAFPISIDKIQPKPQDVFVFTGQILANYSPVFEAISQANAYIEIRNCRHIAEECFSAVRKAKLIETVHPYIYEQLLKQNLKGSLTKCTEIKYGGK